jgi:hypothetical protein
MNKSTINAKKIFLLAALPIASLMSFIPVTSHAEVAGPYTILSFDCEPGGSCLIKLNGDGQFNSQSSLVIQSGQQMLINNAMAAFYAGKTDVYVCRNRLSTISAPYQLYDYLCGIKVNK